MRLRHSLSPISPRTKAQQSGQSNTSDSGLASPSRSSSRSNKAISRRDFDAGRVHSSHCSHEGGVFSGVGFGPAAVAGGSLGVPFWPGFGESMIETQQQLACRAELASRKYFLTLSYLSAINRQKLLLRSCDDAAHSAH